MIDDSPFANLFARPYSAPNRNSENIHGTRGSGGPMGDPFIQRQRAQTARLPRIREIRPTDYKFSIDTPYDEGQVHNPADARRVI